MRRIEDYALIGDGETAALVARDGSIDWLCWPRFDSAACFAALLGTEQHGRWLLGPVGDSEITRRYLPDTLVLETTFRTPSGEVTLTDSMPPPDGGSHVVRMIRGVRGSVKMRMNLVIRFEYGSLMPWVTQQRASSAGELNELSAIAGPDRVTLRTPVAMRGEGDHTASEFTVKQGDAVSFVLGYSPSHLPVPGRIDCGAALERTAKFWREWAGKCDYQGRWRDCVVRSLITLKAL